MSGTGGQAHFATKSVLEWVVGVVDSVRPVRNKRLEPSLVKNLNLDNVKVFNLNVRYLNFDHLNVRYLNFDHLNVRYLNFDHLNVNHLNVNHLNVNHSIISISGDRVDTGRHVLRCSCFALLRSGALARGPQVAA
jgi:uncharacterized protein YjbI with pentapeptide repeats